MLATDVAVAPVELVLVKVTRYFDFFFSAFFSAMLNLPAADALAVPVVKLLQTVLPFFFAQVSILVTIAPGPLTMTLSFFPLPLAFETVGAATIGGASTVKLATSGVVST
jgi:hypothetical protein